MSSINFAFAYIEPDSYKVVTMDKATPASLFEDTANVKAVKEQIQVFISIGGWYVYLTYWRSFADMGKDILR